jgi:PHD/YefM family antitoxin component YafN of YafNO toxin-antitoxin module
MLEAMEKTISMAQLAKNVERIADDIEAAGTVYRIKRPGRRAIVLIDQQYFESRLATLEFMQRHPNWKQELEEGRRQYQAGLYLPYEQIRKELGLDESGRKAKRRSSARRPAQNRPARRR